jgi:hypothetical protein
MEDSSKNQKRRPSLIAALVIEGAERGVDAIIEEQRTMSKPNCFLELERRKKREYTRYVCFRRSFAKAYTGRASAV